MPTKYKRKISTQRGRWTEEQLKNAAEAIENGTMGVNAATKHFRIPKATLLRRKKLNNFTKTGALGPSSTLGEENEAKLVAHIKKLQNFGFAPTRSDVRYMAFALAEQLKIKHRFSETTKMAGYDWLHLFLSRHQDLSIRVAEGVSIARSLALCRDTVSNYFDLLENILTENQLFDKPGNIFNVDETGLQLNNKPGHVIAAKGSKAVASITSGERGETISVIACCSGEGGFLPPYCIFKGKNLKCEFLSGMPPGSVIRMSQKSAYVNTEIFFNWLREHFMPRKPLGKVLLILDGHTSHCNLCEMLEFADEHGIIMLCLPPHTTHYLQPLDRAVFKSLKAHYYTACNNFMKRNPYPKIGRLQFGSLLAEAWSKAALASNAISGFQATGIIPFSPNAIPDYAFISYEEPRPDQRSSQVILNESNKIKTKSLVPAELVATKITRAAEGTEHFSGIKNIKDTCINKENSSPSIPIMEITEPQPGCSHWHSPLKSKNIRLAPIVARSQNNSSVTQSQNNDDITPGKMLDFISPIRKNNQKIDTVKKRGRTLAKLLTSPQHIEQQKSKKYNVDKGKKRKADKITKTKKNSKKTLRKEQIVSSSSESEGEIYLMDDSDTSESWEENDCAGCGENYEATKKEDDWIRCIVCGRWMHESCIKFDDMCDRCGKKMAATTFP